MKDFKQTFAVYHRDDKNNPIVRDWMSLSV